MKKIQLIPLYDRVVIEPASQDQITASGIVIPDSASKEKPQKGTVVAVGTGKVTDVGTVLPMKVSVGDTVFFSQYVPEEVKVDDTTYLILREDSILAIIK